jgi:hypothetical protein
VFHPTARRLDEPYKLYGFTVPQCLALVFGGGGVIAALYYLHVGIQVGGFLGTLVIGVPALYWLLGESGRVQPAELLLDAFGWLIRPSRYAPGADAEPRSVVIASHDTSERDRSLFELDGGPSWE